MSEEGTPGTNDPDTRHNDEAADAVLNGDRNANASGDAELNANASGDVCAERDVQATVLVVEDEPGIANLYTQWLSEDYEVRVANTGREGLDALDDPPDVVLLDRRLPDIPGREVLDEIRSRALDCQVAMVTAIEPDVDVLEMGFDDYVTKPMSRDELQSLVADLVARNAYSATVQRYFRLLSKRAALERELDGDIAAHPEYGDFREEIAAVEATLGDLVDGFTETDFDAQFYRFSDGQSAAGD